MRLVGSLTPLVRDVRGAERHRVLRVRIHRDRLPGRLANHLRHERDARAAADEQHPIEILEAELRAAGRPAERIDRLADAGTDHLLEFGAGQSHLLLDAGQEDLDRRIRIGRQRLLGPPAFLPQTGEGGERGRVVRVQLDPGRSNDGHRAGEERLVEVDPAEPLHAFGTAELLEPGLGLAQDGRVERAATEVVDRDDRAGRHALLPGVVDGGRFGLGQQ